MKGRRHWDAGKKTGQRDTRKQGNSYLLFCGKEKHSCLSIVGVHIPVILSTQRFSILVSQINIKNKILSLALSIVFSLKLLGKSSNNNGKCKLTLWFEEFQKLPQKEIELFESQLETELNRQMPFIGLTKNHSNATVPETNCLSELLEPVFPLVETILHNCVCIYNVV